MTVRVQEGDFDVSEELAALCREHTQVGALASFIGLVREVSQGSTLAAMMLEHYPGMTEKALQAIIDEARQRWTLIDAIVIHRVGRLHPGERIVFVGVASEHRADAFAACEFIIDYLKTRAPFWKKELSRDGERWVEARSADDDAAGRWRRD